MHESLIDYATLGVSREIQVKRCDMSTHGARQSMRDLKDTEELENLFRPYATTNAAGHLEAAAASVPCEFVMRGV